jgi:putative FmdB family regulatory protein
MPNYDYECKQCERTFEVFQSIKEEPLAACPRCGGYIKRIINGGSGIIFKGSGFYSTDKQSGTKTPAGKDAPKAGETKPSKDAPKTDPVAAGK